MRQRTFIRVASAALLLGAVSPVFAQETGWSPANANPKDIEGVWLPARGPLSDAVASPVAATAADTAAQAGDLPPPEIGGLAGPPTDGSQPPPPSAPPQGSALATLKCQPVYRAGGAGGGMANLWIQSPSEIVMISEEDMDVARKIYLGGTHPSNLIPQPNGHSVGHWEGNTLVVDTVGFANLDGSLSDQHVVERIQKQGNSLRDNLTTTKNGKTEMRTLWSQWRPDLHVFENVCEEGFERYRLVDGEIVAPNTAPQKAQP